MLFVFLVLVAYNLTHFNPQLCFAIQNKLKQGPMEINVNEWTSRTALEFIAQGGLGTSLDSLIDGEASSYTKLSKQLV